MALSIDAGQGPCDQSGIRQGDRYELVDGQPRSVIAILSAPTGQNTPIFVPIRSGLKRWRSVAFWADTAGRECQPLDSGWSLNSVCRANAAKSLSAWRISAPARTATAAIKQSMSLRTVSLWVRQERYIDAATS